MKKIKKNKDKLDIKKIVQEECSLYCGNLKKLQFKGDKPKKKDGKFVYELEKQQCTFGTKCKIMNDEPCHYFNDEMIDGYIGYRKKEMEKDAKQA